MMINRKYSGLLLAAVLLAWTLSPLFAQAGSTLSPGGQATVDGKSWLTFTGPGGMRILALMPWPDEARERLERTVSVISSWPTIRVSEVRAESSKGVDDYVLSFASIQSGGRDYSANVPGGLRLRFDGALMYDFRVRSGEYFVRVRGVLMNESSLIAEIVKAVENPGVYIAERDPSWLALRIEQLDKSNTQIDVRTAEINRRLTQKTDETAARMRETEARVLTLSTEIKSRVDTMVADVDTRLGKVQEEAAEDRLRLEEALSANQASFEALRLALASQMNKGLFGGPKPLEPSVIEHVLALKAGNPGTDRTAALDSAKAAGLKTKAKEIDIIFRIWFGE
jgi:hypothetical protein